MDADALLSCTLTFERTSSSYYREAVRLARAIPGYRREAEGERERQTVPLTIATLPLSERLLRLVAGWRGSVVEADGIALYGVEMLRLLGMFSCYRRHERSRLGLLYCWGLPDRGRGRVPCRLVNAVLPSTVLDDYAAPELLPSLLRALSTDTFASLCPAYDAASVQTATAAWVGGALPRAIFDNLLGDLDVDLS